MKRISALLISILLPTVLFSQVLTFTKHYIKDEGRKPILVDESTRTIEFTENEVIVTNLWSCNDTNVFKIIEKVDKNTYVIAYEGSEVVIVYCEKDKVLVVTTGNGVKGERVARLYSDY